MTAARNCTGRRKGEIGWSSAIYQQTDVTVGASDDLFD